MILFLVLASVALLGLAGGLAVWPVPRMPSGAAPWQRVREPRSPPARLAPDHGPGFYSRATLDIPAMRRGPIIGLPDSTPLSRCRVRLEPIR